MANLDGVAKQGKVHPRLVLELVVKKVRGARSVEALLDPTIVDDEKHTGAKAVACFLLADETLAAIPIADQTGIFDRSADDLEKLHGLIVAQSGNEALQGALAEMRKELRATLAPPAPEPVSSPDLSTAKPSRKAQPQPQRRNTVEAIELKIPKVGKCPATTIRTDHRITPAKVLAAVLAVFRDEDAVTAKAITEAEKGPVPVRMPRNIGIVLTRVLCGAEWDAVSKQYGREGTGAEQVFRKVCRELSGDSAMREKMHAVLAELKSPDTDRASAPKSDRKRSRRATTPSPTPEAPASSGLAHIANLTPAGFAAVKQLAETALANFDVAFTAALKGDPNATPEQVEGHFELLMVLLRGTRGMAPR